MRNHGEFIFLMILAAWLCGCSSSEEKVAAFCVSWDQAVQGSEDCAGMSAEVDRVYETFGQTWIRSQSSIPDDSSAWVPCRKAAADMLGRCGYDAAMQDTLKRFQFSNVLKSQQQQ